MRYDLDESMKEFSRRSELMRKKKARSTDKLLFSTTGATAVLLLAMIRVFAGPSVPGQGESEFGAFLLSEKAGGYVIVAVIAFALGILLAVAVLHHSGRLRSRGTKN